MNRKKRNIKRNNIIQLFLSILIIILLNIISSYVFTRFDLTSEKRYTLSDDTKEILKNLDDQVVFTVYLEGDFREGFKRLHNSVREMLDEFRAYTDMIHYKFENPNDIENKDERQKFYQYLEEQGLFATTVYTKINEASSQQLVFPGMIIEYKGRKFPLNLLATEQMMSTQEQINAAIQELEYNYVYAIRKLQMAMPSKIAYTEGHGELEAIWVHDFTRELKKYYQVSRQKIQEKLTDLAERDKDSLFKNKYNLLIIAKPDSSFSNKDLYNIDQFVMRGGRVLWLIDPVFASMDSLQYAESTVGIPMNLRLEKLLFKYGVRINNDMILDVFSLPIKLVSGFSNNKPVFSMLPWDYLPVVRPASDHPIVNNLNLIKTEFVSSIDLVGDSRIKKTVLLQSSDYSKTLNTPAYITLEIAGMEPDLSRYSKKHLPVAVLLEGKFESPFKFHLPPEIAQNKDMDFRPNGLENRMIVVSDGDIIKNQLSRSSGKPLVLGYDIDNRRYFGNKDFLLNCVNYLMDDVGLMNIRSKNTIQLRLLDKTKLNNNSVYWKIFNTAVPVLFIIIVGIVVTFIRKRKYRRIS